MSIFKKLLFFILLFAVITGCSPTLYDFDISNNHNEQLIESFKIIMGDDYNKFVPRDNFQVKLCDCETTLNGRVIREYTNESNCKLDNIYGYHLLDIYKFDFNTNTIQYFILISRYTDTTKVRTTGPTNFFFGALQKNKNQNKIHFSEMYKYNGDCCVELSKKEINLVFILEQISVDSLTVSEIINYEGNKIAGNKGMSFNLKEIINSNINFVKR